MKLIKFLALGTALFYGSTTMAQTVLPTVPTPPAIVTTSPNETDANSVATTNKVYIDQSGQNVDINIVQTGTANVIGDSASPIYMRGDNQNFIGIQTGNGNQIYMSLVSDIGQGSGATATIRQIGDLNYAKVTCGEEQTDASCNLFDMNARFTGNSNSLVFNGSGANIRNSMDVLGNFNTFNIDVSAPNSSQTLLVTGDYNDFDITQTGQAGSFGHSLYVNMTGSLNTFTSQQYGATETTINVTAVGSNGTYNIKSGQ
jgi:hypothetical protein